MRDLYHGLIGMRWSSFLLLPLLGFGLAALFFGTLYCVLGEVSWEDGVRFAVSGMAHLEVPGAHPGGRGADLVSCLQAYCGFLSLAVMSGLTFAKFSVPQARVMFAHRMVVRTRNGVPTLQFRMANARSNAIVEARVQLTAIYDLRTSEGESSRKLQGLELTLPVLPVFSLSNLGVHVLDESSPLFGWGEAEFRAHDVDFVATMVGLDETVHQTVQARCAWSYEDVRWNHRFLDVVRRHEGGEILLDLTSFHETRPLEGVDGSGYQQDDDQE